MLIFGGDGDQVGGQQKADRDLQGTQEMTDEHDKAAANAAISEAYENLGFLSAAPPERSISLSCDKCRVRWTGCQDAAECPRCGDVTAWEAHAAVAYAERKESEMASALHSGARISDSRGSALSQVSAPSGNRRSSSVGANWSPDFTVLAVLPAVSRGGREQQEEGPGRGLDSVQMRQ
jgi:hypothetical protein